MQIKSVKKFRQLTNWEIVKIYLFRDAKKNKINENKSPIFKKGAIDNNNEINYSSKPSVDKWVRVPEQTDIKTDFQRRRYAVKNKTVNSRASNP